jgi:hypothetical protein
VEKAGASILAGGNLAVLKAHAVYGKAVKEADGKLLQQFERANEHLPAKLTAAQKTALLDVVKAEKKRFEAHGYVPWSEPMRPATVAYLQAVQTARGQYRKVCETELEKAAKAKDEASARELADELRDMSEVRVVAFWGHQGGTGPRVRIVYYSNGTVNDPGGKMTWFLDKTGRLVVRWPNPQAPGGAWVDTFQVSRDGKVFSGQNQRGFKINGTLAND